MIDDKHFDALWERAQAEKYAESLAAEYPAWRSRRRRNAGMVAGVALLLAVSAPIALGHQPTQHIYCNNPAINDSHWTETADALLMEA